MKIFISGVSEIETTLDVRGFPVTYYPVDFPFFGINTEVAGSGYRTALTAVALGDEVELMTLIGDDFHGKHVVEGILKAGISDKYVFTALKSTAQSVVLQEVPFGRRQVYSDLKDAQDVSVDAEKMRGAIERADVCALLNVNFSRAFIPVAKSLGKKIATDVQLLSDVYDEFNAEFIENADILFLSDEGISTSREEFMEKLKTRTHAEVIVMGLGEEGVLYCERGGELKRLKAVSDGDVLTAGAGAALFTGFLHYYGKYDCTEALKRAEVCAALKLSENSKSGEYPTEQDVEKKLSSVVF
ncbi:MAG: carbohydrate kinase family protein [Clostridiales bacterium]|nr:carbohydrate kinase family protein [Clostridiales bacterium]